MTTKEEQLAADQAACRHRFKLVGYRTRTRAYDPSSSSELQPTDRLDAVLACMRCAVERLIPVTTIPPAPIIQTGRR